jgi:hypothetical protein
MQICNAGAKYEVRREADFLATPGQGAVPAIDSAASPTLQHWQRRKCEVALRREQPPRKYIRGHASEGPTSAGLASTSRFT